MDLTFKDIDLDRGEILVRHGKGDKARIVPIEDADLIERLKAIRSARGIGQIGNAQTQNTPVFVGTTDKKLAWSSFYRMVPLYPSN